MSEGVRDDFKTMAEIYSRLCTYLDLAATNPPPPLHRGPGAQVAGPPSTDQSPPVASGGPDETGTVNISTGATVTDFVPPETPAHASGAQGTGVPPETAPGTASPATSGRGALSTYIAAAPSFPPRLPDASGAAVGTASSGEAGEAGGAAERLAALEEGLMNDFDVSSMSSASWLFWGENCACMLLS